MWHVFKMVDDWSAELNSLRPTDLRSGIMRLATTDTAVLYRQMLFIIKIVVYFYEPMVFSVSELCSEEYVYKLLYVFIECLELDV